MRIEQGHAAMNGAPRENIYVVMDDSGQRCGHAIVVEYINQAILPQRPLNYFLVVEGFSRARDMLFGAAYSRALALRKGKPSLPARIYTPCSPRDPERLMYFTQQGFVNDDSELIMRWILHEEQRAYKPPVGCQLLRTPLDTMEDCEALLERLTPYSTTTPTMEWLSKIQQEPVFGVYSVVDEERILGEIVVNGYGAEGQIHMLYTDPEYRGRGVARALLCRARALFLSQNIRCVTMQVWERNMAGMRLCEAMGFTQAAQAVLYPGINL